MNLNVPSIQELLDGIPIPIQIYRIDGLMIATNRVSEQFWGAPREVVVGFFNMVTDPQNMALGVHAIFERVAKGEIVTLPPVFYDSSQTQLLEHGNKIWVTVVYFPITNEQGSIEYVGVMHRDVTSEVQQSQTLEETQRELQQERQLQEQRETIELAQREIARQYATIALLSSPVVQVWKGVLMMPLIGELDAQRATTITEDLLIAITRYQSENVILDITGVVTMDTHVASYLLSTVRACRLLGCQVVMVGVGAKIAQTIIHLGVDMSDITTYANLQAGIAWAFEQQGLKVVRVTS
jgi:rsbT co-antagonist protein RsbR